MKYLCLIYDDEKQWQKFPKDVQDKYMAEYMAFSESIKESGQFVGANQLQPTHTATIVRSRNGKVSTTDGPFVETKEQLGGFWVIEAADLDAALAWGRKATVACRGPVEVRPFQDEPEA